MEEIKIIIASDSIGGTAELVARAGISQFNPKQCKSELLRYPHTESFEGADEVIQVAKDTNATIVYTLIKPEMKQYMSEKVTEFQLKSVDITEPLMDLLSASVEEKPYDEPGIVHRLDDAYSKKIDVIEFVVKYGGGKDPKGSPKADTVLLDISRTSKIPLPQYLVHKSYKVMNVPIVPEMTPPDGLYDTDPKKCIALKISEEKLNRIRKEQLRQLGLGDIARYATEARTQEELNYFEKIVSEVGCPVIDVSQKVIEETADDIIRYIEQGESK